MRTLVQKIGCLTTEKYIKLGRRGLLESIGGRENLSFFNFFTKKNILNDIYTRTYCVVWVDLACRDPLEN